MLRLEARSAGGVLKRKKKVDSEISVGHSLTHDQEKSIPSCIESGKVRLEKTSSATDKSVFYCQRT